MQKSSCKQYDGLKTGKIHHDIATTFTELYLFIYIQGTDKWDESTFICCTKGCQT